MISRELLTDQNAQKFQSVITDVTRNNISGDLAMKVASLLALDYQHRLKSTPEITEYLNIICQRLKSSLGHRVFMDEDFSMAMTLFTIAITPEAEHELDKVEQEKSLDAAIDAVINEHYGDLSLEEKAALKDILKELVNSKSLEEVISFVSSDPSFLKELVKTSIEGQRQKQEVLDFAKKHIQQILKQQKEVQQIKSGIKSFTSKVVMITSIITVSSLGIITGGLAFPVMAIPALAITARAAGKVSTKISEKVIENNKSIQLEYSKINNSKLATVSLLKEQKVFRTKTVKKAKSVSKEKANDITKGQLENKGLSGEKNVAKLVAKQKKTSKVRSR